MNWSDGYTSCQAAGYEGLATLSDGSDQDFLYSMMHQTSCNIWVNPTNQSFLTKKGILKMWKKGLTISYQL